MRAGAVLEALASCYRVSVLIAPLYASFVKEMPASLRDLCQSVIRIPAGSMDGSPADAGEGFDIVHVFRLAALGAASPYLKDARTAARHLDLDDIESKTLRRIAQLQRENGEEALAAATEVQARKAELLETVAFRQFQRIYVCSEPDRRELHARCQAEICVLPNVMHAPSEVGARRPDGVWRFLFVGTLGYYPNEDAVVYFATQILPLIRQAAGCPVEFTVAGTGASANLRKMARDLPGVILQGSQPDLAAVYQAADIAIVPIRAGGGTRIKILEAFAHGRPVVASTIGAEGLDIEAGEHLLIGDTPQAFSDCCLSLMTDDELRERVITNALALLRGAYSADTLRQIVTRQAPLTKR